jgi:hypothetical protein
MELEDFNRDCHLLKTLPEYWDAILRGEKTFEVRLNDRRFKKGDVLVLVRLLSPLPDSAPTLLRRVSYILPGGQFGIESGYVVMGLEAL